MVIFDLFFGTKNKIKLIAAFYQDNTKILNNYLLQKYLQKTADWVRVQLY